MAQKNTPLLRNIFSQSFQIVDWELNEIGDSVGLTAMNTSELLDSLSDVSDSVASLSQEIARLHDSLAAIPDSMPMPGSDKAVLSSLTADSVLTDSAHYQGGAASLDSAQLAGWIWNTPQNNHIVNGTFGSYLDASISRISSGAGVYAITVCAQDSATSSPIPYTSLAIRSLDQASLIAVSQTDASGCAPFSLDADSFVVIARNHGYTFAGCDTIVVTGPDNVTITGYHFDPGTPDSPFLCRVYGHLLAIDGSAIESASIVASLPAGVTRSNQLVISPLKITTTTDSTGYFALDLLPSASLIPDDSEYEITITLPGGTILRRRFEVPNTAAWQLTW